MAIDPTDPATAFTERSGTVDSFDEHHGAGRILDRDGRHRWTFHCTRIADGSRTIVAGAPVTFRVEPGPTGLEAVTVGPAPKP